MTKRRPESYKLYLEPGSNESVPLSSLYKYKREKKQRLKEYEYKYPECDEEMVFEDEANVREDKTNELIISDQAMEEFFDSMNTSTTDTENIMKMDIENERLCNMDRQEFSAILESLREDLENEENDVKQN
ncbi:uncharacterized protein LOC127279953 [Leptopilina boulardi]|uniref:uncharacterized protein LOC127279953 n=1 Tax=Leptopilina boulardi TaxID=63433 RepID=UPI0021F5D56B|nr:uncharacterized protein LOC127279953 [Leptopilina boulardi]